MAATMPSPTTDGFSKFLGYLADGFEEKDEKVAKSGRLIVGFFFSINQIKCVPQNFDFYSRLFYNYKWVSPEFDFDSQFEVGFVLNNRSV
jgi:hypothetical protein